MKSLALLFALFASHQALTQQWKIEENCPWIDYYTGAVQIYSLDGISDENVHECVALEITERSVLAGLELRRMKDGVLPDHAKLSKIVEGETDKILADQILSDRIRDARISINENTIVDNTYAALVEEVALSAQAAAANKEVSNEATPSEQ
jgi:hypothetical protein